MPLVLVLLFKQLLCQFIFEFVEERPGEAALSKLLLCLLAPIDDGDYIYILEVQIDPVVRDSH